MSISIRLYALVHRVKTAFSKYRHHRIEQRRIRRLVREYQARGYKCVTNKRFCKHIGKLLLSLDKKKASNILKKIYANKEEWEFKPYTE